MSTDNEHEIAAQLVGQVRGGDHRAEQRMVERYRQGLLLMLKRKAGSDVAEDVAQETWRIVIEKVRAGDLREPEKLAAFIVQLGRNQLIMHYRKSAKESTSHGTEPHNEPAQAQSGPIEQMEQQQLIRSVRRLLSELDTARDREILKRFYLDEQEKSDICEALELSDLHFNRVLYRAKNRLRECLAQAKSDVRQALGQ